MERALIVGGGIGGLALAGAAIVLEDAVVLDEMLAGAGDDVERRCARSSSAASSAASSSSSSPSRARAGIIDPAPDFDVAAFERRVWGSSPSRTNRAAVP